MAAPMKKCYVPILQIFNKNANISSFGSSKLVLQICKSCRINSYAVFRNVNEGSMYLKQKHTVGSIDFTRTLKKGSNSCTLHQHIFHSDVLKQLNKGISNNKTSAVINPLNNACIRTCATNTKSEGHQGTSGVDGIEVKENIYTVPNLLTMSRIVLTPVIGYLVVDESFTIALSLFAFAGFTDMLDGYIARNFKNQMSAFGTALDPLADKILVTVLTVTLTSAGLLPLPLAALIISRDVLLIATGFVIRYVSLPQPRTLQRYFDITNPTAKLLPSTLSKVNTILQLFLICSTLAAPVFDFVNHPALQCLWYLTAATTFSSGIGYIINRKTSIKYLKKTDK